VNKPLNNREAMVLEAKWKDKLQFLARLQKR
jgi:hypothetical protein